MHRTGDLNLRSGRGLFARRSASVRLNHATAATFEAVEARRLMAAVAGVVFNDANANGRRDAGETGAAGQTVFADYNYSGAIDAGEPSVVTDASGNYTLNADLKSFALQVKPASGFAQSAPTGNGPQYFVVTSGALYGTGTTFGVKGGTVTPPPPSPGSVNGTVFLDTNSNGKRDAGENGAAGQTVFADYNYSGTIDAGEPSAVTTADGNYVLAVATRNFALRLFPAAGSTQTSPANNGVYFYEARNGTVVGYGSMFGVSAPVSPATTSIVGAVYFDANANGRRDAGEGPLVSNGGGTRPYVYADLNNNGYSDTGEPGASADAITGQYTINGVPAGATVHLRSQESPWLFRSTQPFGYGDMASYSFSTGPNSATTGPYDFGFTDQGADVTLIPFDDVNGNGLRDAGEPTAYAGMPWLDLNNDGRKGTDEPYFYTPPHETAQRLKLPFGTSRIGFDTSSPADGIGELFQTVMTSAANPQQNVLVPVKVSQTAIGIVFNDANGNGQDDFGEVAGAPVTMFADYNYNGILDAGEPSTTGPTSGGYYSLQVERRNFALTILPPAGSRVTIPTTGVIYYEVRNGELVHYGSNLFGWY